MVAPLRHRQTKEAETDMFDLQPPRHISTLHKAAKASAAVCPELAKADADCNTRPMYCTHETHRAHAPRCCV